ncbi:ABC transporter permease [Candidatus Poriferisodalis sp.]|uniref:ABC transporter permease n=1 Tax=Candidatus Poriferisodalis sp. TaxID=3101277 RepID=UPI003B5A1E1C
MRALRQLRSETSFNLLGFWRSPAATFFTVVLPLVFLVIFTSIFGNEIMSSTGARVATVYVPGILALALVSANFMNAAIVTVIKRENGVLKAMRATPLRPWVYVGGQVGSSLVLTALMTVLVIGIGWLGYGVEIQLAALPSLFISLLVGAAAFSALGLAITCVCPSEQAAPAITNMCVLPLYFVSDVFIPSDTAPRWMTFIGDIFPIKHLAHALGRTFDPFAEGVPMPVWRWVIIGVWGVFGVLVTVRAFRWTPRS